MEPSVQSLPAEILYRDQLTALAEHDAGRRPEGWRLSPAAVVTFIMGGAAGDTEITPKYYGDRSLIEMAVATLLTDRALLLTGEPGTAKSRVSECLAAAVSGDSQKIVQGTSGTGEEQLRYGWNYSMLIARGYSMDALIESPVVRAMRTGTVVRVEELTRCPGDIQDSLISLLSERRMAVAELGVSVPAMRGFSLIATANTRDRGIFAMSSALQRRFNTVLLPAPPDVQTEIGIVQSRVRELSADFPVDVESPDAASVERVVQVFRELRQGETLDGMQKLRRHENGVSVAGEISALMSAMAMASSFRDGRLTARDLAAGMHSALAGGRESDAAAWSEYLENVMKKRGSEWTSIYSACMALIR